MSSPRYEVSPDTLGEVVLALRKSPGGKEALRKLRQEIGPQQLEMSEKDQTGVWNLMKRHPILTGVGLAALTAGALAGGHQLGWLAALPLLDKAGAWIAENGSKYAVRFWNLLQTGWGWAKGKFGEAKEAIKKRLPAKMKPSPDYRADPGSTVA